MKLIDQYFWSVTILRAFFNPFNAQEDIGVPILEISILFLEGTIKKISYECRDYESVDEKSLSLAMSRKTTKKNWYIKG